MFGTTLLLLAAAQFTITLSAPSPFKAESADVASLERRLNLGLVLHDSNGVPTTIIVSVPPASDPTPAPANLPANIPAGGVPKEGGEAKPKEGGEAKPKEGGEGEKKEEEEKKTRANGVMGTPFQLKGNNELQAISFVGSAGVGSMEIEYQNIDGRTLTVTENKTPGAAPLGFKLIDPSSYVVALAEGSSNITRQQIDYVTLDEALKAQNLSAVQTGKLCRDTNAFVVSSALGEQEFEADENESVLKTSNIVREWALFVPA
ncbi:hypothetical protein HYALB_00010561 [Hymenoscyphus albidus]|uniref:Uncharacterized protein n=1 Tax=Hymenoscyphus albidus TaxID=595503 RepID=A0A9N9LKC1_9HELO|nr:hypothetical protein HYALB_00010561 [Hymenoscyphus albidus]